MSGGGDDEAFQEYLEKAKVRIFGAPEKLTPELWRDKLKAIWYMTEEKEEETLPHMQDVLDLLYLLNAEAARGGIQAVAALFPDEKIAKYFLDEYFLEAAKKVMLNFKFRLVETLTVSNKILEEVLMFALRFVEQDHAKFAEVICVVLDAEKRYYQENNQVTEDFNLLQLTVKSEHKDWLASLRPGDLVDAVKRENKLRHVVATWSRARVLECDAG